MGSIEMKNKPHFNETLIEFIKRNVFVPSAKGEIVVRTDFKEKIDSFRADGKKSRVSILGKDGTWLSKELDKWKKKIYSPEKCSFNGTIQNLEFLCELTNSTPNNLLLSNSELIEKCGDEVIYITKDTICEIAEQITKNSDLFTEELLLPVKSRPQRMVTLFVKFYRSQSYTKDIQITYLISEYNNFEGIVTYSSEDDSSKIVNLSDAIKSRITLEAMLSSADDEYMLSCKSFKEYCVDDFSAAQNFTHKRDGDMLLDMIPGDFIAPPISSASVSSMIESATALSK